MRPLIKKKSIKMKNGIIVKLKKEGHYISPYLFLNFLKNTSLLLSIRAFTLMFINCSFSSYVMMHKKSCIRSRAVNFQGNQVYLGFLPELAHSAMSHLSHVKCGLFLWAPKTFLFTQEIPWFSDIWILGRAHNEPFTAHFSTLPQSLRTQWKQYIHPC